MIEIINKDGGLDADDLFDLLQISNDKWWNGDCPWMFRGQSNFDWELLPQAWRKPGINPLINIKDWIEQNAKDKNPFEVKINKSDPYQQYLYWINAELEAVARFIERSESIGLPYYGKVYKKPSEHSFSYVSNDFLDYSEGEIENLFLKNFMLAQHHGIPTSLLDWTVNPESALYFALSDDANKEIDSSVYAINAIAVRELIGQFLPHKYSFYFDRDLSFQNEYMAKQKGVVSFLTGNEIMAHFRKNNEFPSIEDIMRFIADSFPGSKNYFGGKFLYKIKIGKKSKERLRLLLRRKQISRASLMPTYDNAAESVLKEFEVG